jgi:hypothetical protein
VVRILLALGVVLLVLAGFAAAVGVLAYGTEPAREGEITVAGLDAPVAVAWADGGVTVEAETEAAAAAGLGYAHAADYGWPMALWRQAARGALAEWLGDSLSVLDVHARALGFADLARQTYEALPAEDRRVLDAYARGADRAFGEPGVAQGDPFLAAGVEPGPWAPWDALAVERLHAYLAAPALHADSSWQAARADSAVASFVRADSLFRAALGYGSASAGRVYAVGRGADRVLVHQVPAGSSALPLLAPATVRVGGRGSVLLTIPGTLVAPSGWSGGFGWGLLRGGALALERYGGAAPPPVYSRLTGRDGDEALLSVARDASGLVLRAGRPGTAPAGGVAADSARADGARDDSTASGWRVRWAGFRVGTDLGAFRALRAGRVPPALVVTGGDGLAATAADLRVLGSPPITARGPGWALAARDTLARYGAARLAAVARDSGRTPVPGALADDARSAWAAARLPALLRALGNRDSLAVELQAPYSFLASWDADYRADGIAPSIFEEWLVAHRAFAGDLPDPADSLDAALLPYTLRIARAELRDRFGPLPSDWRWGRLQDRPRYPVLGGRGGAAGRRFREPLGPPGGHPTALAPGPSLVFDEGAPAVALWSVATRLGDGVTVVRSPASRPPPRGVLEPDADVGPLVLDPSAPLPERRLLLVPPS